MDEQQSKRFCTHCGTELNPGAAFCSKCGTPVGGAPTPKKAAAGNDGAQLAKDAVQNATATVRKRLQASCTASHPVIAAIKKLMISPLGLLAAISFSLMLILTINNAGTLVNTILKAIPEAADLFSSLGSAGSSILSTLRSGARLITLLISLPDIVIAVGIWMTVYAAFEVKNTISTAGLRVIRVVNTIQLIFTIILTFSYIVLAIEGMSATKEYYGKVPFLTGLLFVVVLVFFIFRAYCYVQADCLLRALTDAIEGPQQMMISPFMGIISFVAGGAYLLQALTAEGGAAAIAWFGAIANICFGIWVMQYRKSIGAITAETCAGYSKKAAAAQSAEAAVSAGADTPDEDAEEGVTRLSYQVDAGDEQAEGAGSGMSKKVLAIAGAAIAAVILLAALFSGGSGGDKRLVGKWRFNSNEDAVIEFKRNGTYINNAGTEYEERGTYRTEDGVIYVTIDGEEVEYNYRMDDSDTLEIEREYWSGWNWSSKWVEFWRVK